MMDTKKILQENSAIIPLLLLPLLAMFAMQVQNVIIIKQASSTYSAGTGIGITGNVISCTGCSANSASETNAIFTKTLYGNVIGNNAVFTNLTLRSIITSYNGITTQGQGMPVISALVYEKRETTTDANVLSYTTSPTRDELLRINANIDDNTFTGTSLILQVAYKDSYGTSQTQTLVTLTGIGDSSGSIIIHVLGNSQLTVKTTFIGVSTNYVVSSSVERFT